MDEENELDIDLNVHILNLTVVFGWEDTSQTVIFLWSQVLSYHWEAEFSRFFHVDPFWLRYQPPFRTKIDCPTVPSGMGYVALSRVRKSEDIKIMTPIVADQLNPALS